jgi:uncharacterized protein
VAIKLTRLEQVAQQYTANQPSVYIDLHLDYQVQRILNTSLGYPISGNDIRVDYDESAIKNSLINLFNTKPGQRFLFPTYGLDLNQYLFEAITTSNARTIGTNIVNSIEKYEPRVKVINVNVSPDEESNLYNITIAIQIPIFNTTTTLNTILDVKTKSFIYLQSPRNR